MNRDELRDEAVRLLSQATDSNARDEFRAYLIARAQVYATLALTAPAKQEPAPPPPYGINDDRTLGG